MTNWSALDQELAAWDGAGRTFDLWWRDDDAVATGPKLERLRTMAAQFDLPLHLAIIPADLTQSLINDVMQEVNLVPFVHGWQHRNHEPADRKKCEFGPARSLGAQQADIKAGLARLQDAFGSKLCPIFVPPWNRMDKELYPTLSALGFKAVSQFQPRLERFAAPGLRQINTHIDPIAWKAGGGLAEPQWLVDHTTQVLKDRRLGTTDNDEPLGLLTHHIVHDSAVWAFCIELLSHLRQGPMRPWRADAHFGDLNEPT